MVRSEDNVRVNEQYLVGIYTYVQKGQPTYVGLHRYEAQRLTWVGCSVCMYIWTKEAWSRASHVNKAEEFWETVLNRIISGSGHVVMYVQYIHVERNTLWVHNVVVQFVGKTNCYWEYYGILSPIIFPYLLYPPHS